MSIKAFLRLALRNGANRPAPYIRLTSSCFIESLNPFTGRSFSIFAPDALRKRARSKRLPYLCPLSLGTIDHNSEDVILSKRGYGLRHLRGAGVAGADNHEGRISETHQQTHV